MRVPYSWLSETLNPKPTPEELEELLHSRGVSVEKLEYPAVKVSGVTSGVIREIKPHPNADRLRITMIDVGEEASLQVVTAAANVCQGMPVALARVGASLFSGLNISKSVLRGVESFGMLCSAQELGLNLKDLPEEQQSGVMEIPGEIRPGTDLAELFLLNDPVFIFEIFANRPDLLSVEGIAREARAALGQEYKTPETVNPPEQEADLSSYLSLKVEDLELCPRYMGKLFLDVKIKPSPSWMAYRLMKAGLRPVNNVVDITNYVMLEKGQPLHAFDYDKLAGKQIIVRRALPGEKIRTIDESEAELTPEMLVIADAEKPVAVAGVMGGKFSEISSHTTRIFLEVARFAQVSIRRTSLKLGIKSESQRRFEKGIDYYQIPEVMERATQLLAGTGAKPVKGVWEQKAAAPSIKTISLLPARVSRLVGVEFSEEECRRILNLMNCRIAADNEGLLVTPPTFRPDLNREEDLIEEIVRISGYNRIPETMPAGLMILGRESQSEQHQERLRDLMTGLGFWETVTFSLSSPEQFARFNLDLDDSYRVANPLVEDQCCFRTVIFPSLLGVVKRNLISGQKNLAFFEVAGVYRPLNGEVDNRSYLAMMIAGEGKDFPVLKGQVQQLFNHLKVEKPEFKASKHSAFHPGVAAEITSGGLTLGVIGKLHPEIAQRLEIKVPVFAGEFEVENLFKAARIVKYQPLPRYPEVNRDLAFTLKQEVACGEVIQVIEETGGKILTRVECFDRYQGSQIAEGFQSMAFHLTFQSQDKTLVDEEVQKVIEQILLAVKERLGAELRS